MLVMYRATFENGASVFVVLLLRDDAKWQMESIAAFEPVA